MYITVELKKITCDVNMYDMKSYGVSITMCIREVSDYVTKILKLSIEKWTWDINMYGTELYGVCINVFAKKSDNSTTKILNS